jgi:putative endonuclease
MGTMEQHKHLLGQWAEQTALLFLQSQQYQYVNKNYHSRFGEIDLIVKRGNELVFVEVKARSATQNVRFAWRKHTFRQRKT